MKSNMTIGMKLGLTCATLVLLAVVLGATSVYSVSAIHGNLDIIVTDSLPGVYQIGVLESLMLEQRGNYWKFLAGDAAVMADMDRANGQLRQKFDETSGAYEKTIHLAEDRQLFGAIKPAHDRYLAAWEAVAALKRAGKTDEAVAKYGSDMDPAFRAVKEAVRTLVDWNKKNGDRNAEAASATVAGAQFWSWLLLVSSLVAGVLLAFLVTRNINRALTHAITELTEGAEHVAGAAGQVSSSSQAVAQGSSEQAASLEETSASSEQINAMARKNSENSREAAGLVTGSQQRFMQANQALGQTVSAMGEIHTQSGKISKIIKVIDEIAFQTNILALNAAVEAARAGEAGMGFAVVADEVRNLAQRCAQAARDTAELIEESIAKSNDGKVKVDQVASVIRQITEEAERVKTLVDEVNQGSMEQSRGIEEVAKAVLQMQTVTQSTAAGAEESASAAQELTAQSQALKKVVEGLRAMMGGGIPSRVPSRSVLSAARVQTVKAPAPAHANDDEFPMD